MRKPQSLVKSQTQLEVHVHECGISAPHLTGQLNNGFVIRQVSPFCGPKSQYLFQTDLALFSIVKRPLKYASYMTKSPYQQILAAKKSGWWRDRYPYNKSGTLAASGGKTWTRNYANKTTYHRLSKSPKSDKKLPESRKLAAAAASHRFKTLVMSSAKICFQMFLKRYRYRYKPYTHIHTRTLFFIWWSQVCVCVC